jgi:hypothetical protein
MNELKTGELTVTCEIDKSSNSMIFTWLGQSTDQDPGKILKPYFEEIISEARKTGASIVFDFKQMEYMNSSTIAPVIYMISLLKEPKIQLTIKYQTGLKWQELNFSTFKVLEKSSGILKLAGE